MRNFDAYASKFRHWQFVIRTAPVAGKTACSPAARAPACPDMSALFFVDWIAKEVAAPLPCLPPARPLIINSPMKAILSSIAIAGAFALTAGCESDVPPAQDAGHTLERGLTGQGKLVQPDRSNDPIIREQTRVGY